MDPVSPAPNFPLELATQISPLLNLEKRKSLFAVTSFRTAECLNVLNKIERQ